MANKVLDMLKKYDGKARKVEVGAGYSDLPAGSYIGVITKGEVRAFDDKKVAFVQFSGKVTEGPMKGSGFRVSQNIIKNDGDLNEIGVSIVKGALKQMLGADKVADIGVSDFVLLVPKAAGFGMKFRVQEDGERTNYHINAILPKGGTSEEAEPAAEVEAEEAEVAEEAEEAEGEEEAADPTPEEVLLHLRGRDRSGLKDFIKENDIKFTVMKKHSDDDIRKGIVKELGI